MEAHKLQVEIPKDRRATIEFPQSIRTGPVELIVLVPEDDAEISSKEKSQDQSTGRSLGDIVDEIRAVDPRPFEKLNLEERRERLRRLRGAGSGLFSTSQEFAETKRFEAELETRKFEP